MSQSVHEFDAPGTPRIAVRMSAGDVKVVKGREGAVVVRLEGSDRRLERMTVSQLGDQVSVEEEQGGGMRRGGVDVHIEVGEPCELQARLGLGDIVAQAHLASLEVDVASGDLRIGGVEGEVHARTAAGDLRAGRIGGRLELKSAAGDVRVDEIAGAVDLKTASGDVHIGRVGGDLNAKTGSGDVMIGTFDGDVLEIASMAGDVAVGVPGGRSYRVSLSSLSGDIRTDFPVSDDESDRGEGKLSIKSMSGDIVIRPG